MTSSSDTMYRKIVSDEGGNNMDMECEKETRSGGRENKQLWILELTSIHP